MLLTNRIAIVTGGAVGIGRGIALKFAEEDCSVVVADISEKEGKKTALDVAKTGRHSLFIRCDVTDSRQVQAMFKEALNRFRRIDILVNNAGGVPGVKPGAGIEDITDEAWEKIINLNLLSTFYCCRAAVPIMKQKKYGKIINISSIGAIQPSDSVIHYHSAKAGVIGLTTNLAFDLAPYNICVNAIMPGPIRTPFWEPVTRGIADKESFFTQLAKENIPLQRIGTPEDVAGAALFLASELSSYVTGDVINVSGGVPLLPHGPNKRRNERKHTR